MFQLLFNLVMRTFVLRVSPYTRRDLIYDARKRCGRRTDSRSVREKLHCKDSLNGSPEMPPPLAGADYEDGVLVK